MKTTKEAKIDDKVLPSNDQDGLDHPLSEVNVPMSGTGLVRKGVFFLKIYHINVPF